MTDETTQAKAGSKVCVKIKTFRGAYATGGVFLARGQKLEPGQVCELSEAEYKNVAQVDALEKAEEAATHKLVRGQIVEK